MSDTRQGAEENNAPKATVLSKGERAAILVVLIKDVLETAAQIHGAVLANYPGMVNTVQEIAVRAGGLLTLSLNRAERMTGAQHDKEMSELFYALTHAPVRQEKAFIELNKLFIKLEKPSYELSSKNIEGVALAIASSESQGLFEEILRAALLKIQLEVNLAAPGISETDRPIF